MDWNDLIGGITDRLTTLENYNPANGQHTAEILGNLNVIDAKFENLLIPIAENIPLYENYVGNRFLHVTTVDHDKFVSHDANLAQIHGSIDVAGSNFDTTGNKFRAIEDAMNRSNESMQLLHVQMASVGDPVGNPTQLSMGTPQQQQHPQRPQQDDGSSWIFIVVPEPHPWANGARPRLSKDRLRHSSQFLQLLQMVSPLLLMETLSRRRSLHSMKMHLGLRT